MERKETYGEKKNSNKYYQDQPERKKKGHFCREGRGCYFLKGERVLREQRSSWHSKCDSKSGKKNSTECLEDKEYVAKRQKQRKIIKRVLKGKNRKLKGMNISNNYLRIFPEMSSELPLLETPEKNPAPWTKMDSHQCTPSHFITSGKR